MAEKQVRESTKTMLQVNDEKVEGGDGGYNAGIAVFSYILGGILVWSLIGWGLDNLWGTRWIVLAGAFLGAAGGFYLAFAHRLIRRSSHPDEASGSGSSSGKSEQQ